MEQTTYFFDAGALAMIIRCCVKAGGETRRWGLYGLWWKAQVSLSRKRALVIIGECPEERQLCYLRVFALELSVLF